MPSILIEHLAKSDLGIFSLNLLSKELEILQLLYVLDYTIEYHLIPLESLSSL